MKRLLSVFAISMIPFFGLVGCETIRNFDSGVDEHQTLARPVIQVATITVIDKRDDVTAQGVLSAVEDFRERLDTADTVELSALRQELFAYMARHNVSLATQIAIAPVVDMIEAQLTELDLVDDGRRERIALILDWIEEAAQLVVNQEQN